MCIRDSGSAVPGGTYGEAPVRPRVTGTRVTQAITAPTPRPVAATSSASQRIMRRTCPRVVPASRSSATSRRRSSTVITRVFAAVTAANPPSTPAITAFAQAPISWSLSAWAAKPARSVTVMPGTPSPASPRATAARSAPGASATSTCWSNAAVTCSATAALGSSTWPKPSPRP